MAKYKLMPPLELLQRTYRYDPTDGYIYWVADSPNGQRFCGDIASRGLQVRVGNTTYKTSRLAWFMGTGQDPAHFHVDHINGDIHDNRLENLRLATYSQNQANSTATRAGRTLPKGVYQRGSRYRAYIKAHGRSLCLGTFCTPEEASAAYQTKAKESWGDYSTYRTTPSYYRPSSALPHPQETSND
jgi:hypothetical protein